MWKPGQKARVISLADKEGNIRNAFESQINIGKHVRKALEVVKSLS